MQLKYTNFRNVGYKPPDITSTVISPPTEALWSASTGRQTPKGETVNVARTAQDDAANGAEESTIINHVNVNMEELHSHHCQATAVLIQI